MLDCGAFPDLNLEKCVPYGVALIKVIGASDLSHLRQFKPPRDLVYITPRKTTVAASGVYLHGELVGCGLLTKLGHTTGVLNGLYVRDDYRGQALGALLVRHRVAVGRAIGLTRFKALTRAHKTYERAGFSRSTLSTPKPDQVWWTLE